MYLSVNCNLGGEDQENTPRTPDIINSIVNMNGPPLLQHLKREMTEPSGYSGMSPGHSPPMIPMEGCPALPSIEQTRMNLIKEDLKHKIKARNHNLSCSDFESDHRTDLDEPTPEDRDKRTRRRERNKVAATKCRNKKKEKYVILMHDEKVLESDNLRLRQDKAKYEREFEDLLTILRAHRQDTSCPIGGASNLMELTQIINPPQPTTCLPTSSPASLGSPYSVCATPSPQSAQHAHYYTDSSPYQMGLSPTLPEAPPHPSIEHASQVMAYDAHCGQQPDLTTNPYMQNDVSYSSQQDQIYSYETGDDVFLNTINCF